MESNRQKYEYFFPRKVYHCACLSHVIQESFDDGNHSLVDILDNIKKFDFLDVAELDKVFCVKCGNDNKDCIFVCERHLAIVLLVKRKFICTQTENAETATVVFDGKKETYCLGCIKHYLRLMFHYFYFVDFEQNF